MMSQKHHILIFEGMREKPGSSAIMYLSRKKGTTKVLKKVTQGKHEFYIFNLIDPPKKTSKLTTKVHFIEIGRARGKQAFEVHYDVLPRLNRDGTRRSITEREIPNIQLTDEQMMGIINQLEPILKRARISIRWIKPGEEIDV